MDTLAFLGDLTPAFAVRGCQVKVLSEPSEFYNELCTRARLSKRRICMAALYLGTFSVPNFSSLEAIFGMIDKIYVFIQVLEKHPKNLSRL